MPQERMARKSSRAMKVQFYLLDLNEGEWEGKPCARLWGIDDKGKRILVLSTQIAPYFYFAPVEEGKLESFREKVLEDKKRFPEVIDVTPETRKLLGKECQVLKVTCHSSGIRQKYATQFPKALGSGSSFEQDIRLAVRYLVNMSLICCGWNECDADEIQVDRIEKAYFASTALRSISEEKIPRMRVLAFNILTAAENGSARAERDPVRAICVAADSGKSMVLLSDGEDDSKLLKDFVQFLTTTDPDVVVGFESNTKSWPYLIQRAKANKVKLSVGRDSSEPHTSVYGHVSVTGRVNLDLFDVIGAIPQVKVKNLENVAAYLPLRSSGKFTSIEEWDTYRLWSDETARRKLLQNQKTMAEASLELAEATLNFPMQLSALTGLPLDQVMAAAVGFRVDSYLIRQAHRIRELIPSKNEQPFFTYRGALVLEPETGLHENVAVLDFASMYPKLMKKYNLSPDTLVKPGEHVPQDSIFVIPEVNHRFRKEPDGLYRIVLSSLIDERGSVKRKLEKAEAGSTEYRVLRERERALKVVTNACYGYAGWAGARWYVREVAESASALGRETITKAISKADSLGLKVIYGDTDSIFVNNDRSKIRQLLSWVEKDLDLEISVEHEYVRVLFTEAMKRYAGLLPDQTLDIVGLEVVRGDWSDIARQVQEQVLENVLRDQSIEKAVETVRKTIQRLKQSEVPIADLAIRKTLTKPIEQYAVRVPDVEVARKLAKQGWELSVGDKVAYVITKGPGQLFKKAKPYHEARSEDIDIDYYLENQVKPPAMRILERFGVNEDQLAT